MKTTINILRSIITSLLFLILIVVLIVQFAFTAIRLSGKTIPDLIDQQKILEVIMPDVKLDEENKEMTLQYIDQYINYIFYKRSFPSIQGFDYGDASAEEIKVKEKILVDLRKKIDMKYDNVLMLRNINNFLSNGSIYLLINIGVLVVILLILISTFKINKTIILSSIALMLSGILILIAGSIILSQLPKLLDPLAYNFVKDIFDGNFTNRLFNQSLIYLSAGLLLFIVTFIVSKVLLKKQN